MARLDTLVMLVLHLIRIFTWSYAFTLDTSVPLVKEGVENSYFGFAVAQHQIDQTATKATEHVILVGAPKDNFTIDGVPDEVVRLHSPGVLYKCPITSLKKDCQQLKIGIEVPGLYEDRNGQWFGVSVASQGTPKGVAVVCAHRYRMIDKVRPPSFVWGLGMCISVSNTLEDEQFYLPCEGQTMGHTRYGFCQAGTSVGLDPASNNILVGNPGTYNWRGSLAKNLRPEGLENVQWYRSPVADIPQGQTGPEPATKFYSYLGMATKIGKIINRETTYIGGAPRSNNTGEVLMFTIKGSMLAVAEERRLAGEQFGSGFGHDIAIIDLNDDELEDIVIGAPFYYGHGFGGAIYVYMNNLREGITNRTEPIRIHIPKMNTEECKRLNCEDSRFGLSLANVGDIDLDGFNDLAVGAPYEGNGAVYIFRGSPGGIITTPSQRITARDLLLAQPLTGFGYSLSGGNDVDQNGYTDLVVGSYESNKVVVLRSRPVIHVHSNMNNFPEKIDPDVKVCERDNKPNNCFKLRVCFMVTAETANRFDQQIELEYKVEAETFTGKKISRVFFKQRGQSEAANIIKKSITLNIVQSDSGHTFKCKDHYVYISNNNRDFLNPIDFQLTYKLREQPPPTMAIGDELPDFDYYPVLNEAIAKYESQADFVKNCGVDSICHSDLEVRGLFEGLDQDYSGSPVLKVGQVDELRLAVRVRNYQEDAHETILTVRLPESVKYTNTDPADNTMSAACGSLYSSSRVGHCGGCYEWLQAMSDACPPSLQDEYHLLFTTQQYSCSPQDNIVTCYIGNPLKKDKEVKFVIRLNAADIAPTLRHLDITLSVNTTSTETDTENDMMFLAVKVRVETDMLVRSQISEEVFYSGDVRGESAITREEDIGSMVIHTYEVKNNGKGKVANSTVYIYWPFEVDSEYQHGKHLLYLLEPPKVEAPAECFLEAGMVNPLGVQLNEQYSLETLARLGRLETRESRKRRDTSAAEAESQPRIKRQSPVPYQYETDKGKTLKVVYMECDRQEMQPNGLLQPVRSARCFRFPCVMGELLPTKSVTITMRARIWNSTFLEDYRNVDQVRIKSKAKIVIDPVLNIQQTNVTNDIDSALTIAIPDILIKEPPSVPLWVIILAAVGGFLLLIIIIILLWKCGFFKRKKPGDDTRQYKGKVYKKPKNDFMMDYDDSRYS